MEPRPYAFHKMEALMKQMQDPETGVPVRSQKFFLTSVPSAFIGYDLIEWLMEHLNIEESGEAVHLANQLCQYGYLFPVTDCKNLTVKDDNSLYRFQTAYYWPWHHRNPDNVEYAIYLVKRTLRNKQRHALEDYEVDAFSSLKKNLQNKWELITMQAEEQAEDGNIVPKNSGPCVKVGKERKKMDKLVADSQERAYWRVHRPPPGNQPPLEPSPIITLRRSISPPQNNTELQILQRQMSRSRVKVSQAVENLLSYSTTYAEYDPFFTQPQPSNPWLSDDPAFWQFDQPIVEIPTERRVKRWALSFEDLLADPTGVEEFSSFLRKEYSHENIRFWLAVKELRYCAQSQVSSKVNAIYQEFLAHGAPCEVNIDSKTQETTTNEMKTPSRFTFDAAAHHVYTVLLNKDCYPRFIRSEQYKNLLAIALHPPTKKRFFGFGGVGKKKSCPSQIIASTGVGKRRGSDRSLTGIVHEVPPFVSTSAQSYVPLSTSQSNLHDLTITRDTGVSPEKISVVYREAKQKSMEERKPSSDDERPDKSLSEPVPPPKPSIEKTEPPVETVVVKLSEISVSEIATIVEPDVEIVEPVAQPAEPEPKVDTSKPLSPPTKHRRNAKKTRLLSEDGSAKSHLSKLTEETKQISVDFPPSCSVDNDSSEPCKEAASDVADEPSDTQNRTDICPWEDEENCKTEEPFVKKYATLGYL